MPDGFTSALKIIPSPPDDGKSDAATSVPSPGLTLAELRAAVLADPALAESRRANLAWAFGAVEKRLPQPLAQVPATAADLDAVIRAIHAAGSGLKRATIHNLAALLGAALAAYGPPPPPSLAAGNSYTSQAGAVISLASEWEVSLSDVSDRFARMVLARFAAWCSAVGIMPAGVGPAVLDRYAAEGTGRLKAPKVHLRKLRRAWNRAADAVPGWPAPRLPDPAPRRRDSLAWGELHPTLRAALDTHYDARVAARLGPPRLTGPQVAKLKPRSAEKAKWNIRLFLGAARSLGEDPGQIATIAGLLEPARAEAVLIALRDRAQARSGTTQGTQAANIAATLCALAEHAYRAARGAPHGADPHAGAAEHAVLERLREFQAALRPQYRGMVEWKRRRLLPLRDPAVRRRLLELPYCLAAKGARASGKAGARLVQTAVAIELLLATCLRIENLAGLRLDRHLERPAGGGGGRGRRGRRFVFVPSEEVKNGELRQIELRPETAELLEAYERDFRPLLAEAGDPFLFPGRRSAGGGACPGALGQRIKRAIHDGCGLVVNAHLFRSIAVMLYLEHRPGDFATMLHVLGDRKLETVLRHYTWIDGAAAYDAYQQHVLAGRRIEAPLRILRTRGAGGMASRRGRGRPATTVEAPY